MKRLIRFVWKNINKKKAIDFLLGELLDKLDHMKNKRGLDVIPDDVMKELRDAAKKAVDHIEGKK